MIENVLITGGMGYLGGRIVKYLSENTELRLRISTRKALAETPKWLKNGKVISPDLNSERDLLAACEGIQAVIHLSALNEIESSKDPELALRVNGLCTLKLLRAAQKTKVERFIYFSTAHVYGSPLRGIITENSLPRPIHPYAITHRIAEDFVLAVQDLEVLTGIVIRLSNGFGAPISAKVDRWSLIVNDLCRQAVTTKKLVLRTAGMQKRDFITLTDVCRAALHFLNLPDRQCGNGLFNLGGDYSIKIVEMAELIAGRCLQVHDFKPDIQRPISQPDEAAKDFEYSINKIKSTGFQLLRNIEDEIDSMLIFCQKEFGYTKGL